MPNSPWTETGSSVSLVPTSSLIDGGSSPQNVNYITNSDKILLIAQYTAELQVKTQLDTTAGSLGVPTTNYDNAVAQINTSLTAVGAPASWATTWPDGTTSGPWTAIQTTLANDWSGIATARTSLQNAISAAQASQQAAAAQAAAIAAAATDATTKMNTAVSIAAPMVVSALPTLPSTTYPTGKIVWNTADGNLYQSTGSAWSLLGVNAASLAANTITAGQIAAGAIGANQIAANSITADQMVIANFDNLIPNPTSEQPAPAGGWPPGAFEATALTTAAAHTGTHSREVAGTGVSSYGTVTQLTPLIPCAAGDMFYIECWMIVPGGSGQGFLTIASFDSSGAAVSPTNYLSSSSTWAKVSGTYTVPSGVSFIAAQINVFQVPVGSFGYFDDFYLRRMADANLLVDGCITASKIATGAITADMITTGTLNAASVNVTNLNATDITTGTLDCTSVVLNNEKLSTFLNGQGSIIPLQPFAFSYTTTTTSVTISWSATTLYRSDGSTITISSGSLTYSSLTASHGYWVYLYIDIPTLTVVSLGAPGAQSSYLAIQSQFDGRAQINPLYFLTPASGTGGGSGGSTCPEASELIDVQGKGPTRADAVRMGDLIRGYDFTAKQDVYRRVVLLQTADRATWRVVEGHRVSPVEPVYVGGKWMPAYEASPIIATDVSIAIHITVDAAGDEDHNYYLVGDTPLLIHNVQPVC